MRHATAQEAKALSAAASSDLHLQRLAAERDELTRTVQQLRHQVSLQEKQQKKADETIEALRQRLKARLSPEIARGITRRPAAGIEASEPAPSIKCTRVAAASPLQGALYNKLQAQQRAHLSLLGVFNDVYGILLAAVTDYEDLKSTAKAAAAAAIQASSKQTEISGVKESSLDDLLAHGSSDITSAVHVLQRRCAGLLQLTSQAETAPGDSLGDGAQASDTLQQAQWMKQWPTEQQIDAAIPQLQAQLDAVQQAVDDLAAASDGSDSAVMQAVQSGMHCAQLVQANQSLHRMLAQASAALQTQHALLLRAAACSGAAPPPPPRHLTPSQLLGASPEVPHGQRERFLRRRLAALDSREQQLRRREEALEAGEIALLCASPANTASRVEGGPLLVQGVDGAAASGAEVPKSPSASASPSSGGAGLTSGQGRGNRTPLGPVSSNTPPAESKPKRAHTRELKKPWHRDAQPTARKSSDAPSVPEARRKRATAFTIDF